MSSVGIPWIDKSDYAKLREIFTDGDLLPEKFEDWQRRIHEATKVYQAINVKVVRVRLEPRSFAAWCLQQNLAPGNTARRMFISSYIQQAC